KALATASLDVRHVQAELSLLLRWKPIAASGGGASCATLQITCRQGMAYSSQATFRRSVVHRSGWNSLCYPILISAAGIQSPHRPEEPTRPRLPAPDPARFSPRP